MRDPFEFIQFFKRHVYHEVADEYHDFLEDLKILRENHIMIKGHEQASGKNFVKLGQRLRNQLQKLTVIQQAYQNYPDELRVQTVENLSETLIYEQIGANLRRQIFQLYESEEVAFRAKCVRLLDLWESDANAFNSALRCQLMPNMSPNKSLRILKLFLERTQLPFEMMFVLTQTMQAATIELAEFYNKDRSQIDAETLIPYLALVVIAAVAQVEPDNQKHCFKTRLLMAEFFTVRESMLGGDFYAFATVRNVEQMIDQTE